MGEANVIVNQWLGTKKRFADLFNGYVFEGRQIVDADNLEPLDREADIIVTGKDEKKGRQRYRDIIMRWGNVGLAILACENQDKVHYAMPVRMMVYDGLSYTDQIQKLWEKNRRMVRNPGTVVFIYMRCWKFQRA